MQMESWVGTIEREWHQLRRADPALDVEKFSRHVIAANKTGFLSPESLAAIANALLTSTLSHAPRLGTGAHWRQSPSSLANGNGHFPCHADRWRGGL
jgi:hypothetical protein